MPPSWTRTLEEMVVEKGTMQGMYYTATITSGEVLQRIGAVATPYNHRNVLNMINWHYPQSSCDSIGANGQGGWTLHIKIRTK